MRIERFIAGRISRQDKGSISRPIVKIGIAGIAVGIAVMIVSVAIVLGFKREIISRITGLTSHITLTSINTREGGEAQPLKLGGDTLRMISADPAVKSITGVAFKNGILKTKSENEGLLLKGVGKDYDFTNIRKYLVEGRTPGLSAENAEKEVMISRHLADRMNIRLADKLIVYFIVRHQQHDSAAGEVITKTETRARDLRVCGIFETSFADFDEKLAIVDIRHLQRLNYWEEGMCGAYEVTLHSFDSIDNTSDRISGYMGYEFNVIPVTESYFNIFIWLEKLDVNGVIIIVLMIVVATINMITALLILILERTNMIGMLKAQGMTNKAVRRIFLHVSTRLISRGLLWGNLAGIGICLIQYYTKAVALDAATYYVDHIAISLDWGLFLVLNLVTVLVCLAMLVLPTLIITRLTPVKTIRFD